MMENKRIEGEAVPAKVAANYDLHNLLACYCNAEPGDSTRIARENIEAHVDAKVAEALNRQAKLIHEGDLRLMNELQQRAEAEATRCAKEWADAVSRAAQVPQAGQSSAGTWCHHYGMPRVDGAGCPDCSAEEAPAPIDMVLHCPKCGLQHIDAPEEAEVFDTGLGSQYEMNPDRWDNPPHRSHLCHGCAHVWRPADVPTNGVAAVTTTGSKDSPIVPPQAVDERADDLLCEIDSALMNMAFKMLPSQPHEFPGLEEAKKTIFDAAMGFALATPPASASRTEINCIS